MTTPHAQTHHDHDSLDRLRGTGCDDAILDALCAMQAAADAGDMAGCDAICAALVEALLLLLADDPQPQLP